jgi:Fe-S cluster assembly iron-binding protein IscA
VWHSFGPDGRVIPRQSGPPAAVEPERRNIVALTPAAAAKLLEAQRENAGFPYLRVRVEGLERKLDLESEYDPNADLLGESGGVKILVDRKSAELLPDGVTVDYVNADGQDGFKFTAARLKRVITAAALPEARKGFQTKPPARSRRTNRSINRRPRFSVSSSTTRRSGNWPPT